MLSKFPQCLYHTIQSHVQHFQFFKFSKSHLCGRLGEKNNLPWLIWTNLKILIVKLIFSNLFIRRKFYQSKYCCRMIVHVKPAGQTVQVIFLRIKRNHIYQRPREYFLPHQNHLITQKYISLMKS